MHSIFWTLRRRLYHLTCLSALDLVVWGMLDGAIRGRCLIVCEAGSAVSADWLLVHGSYGGRGLHAWLRPGRHLNVYITLLLTLCLQCMDIGIDGQWYGVRHFGFRGPVNLGAWSTWRGPWAAGRPEWRVIAGCVDVYIRELDARGAEISCPVFTSHFTGICSHAASDSDRERLHKFDRK